MLGLGLNNLGPPRWRIAELVLGYDGLQRGLRTAWQWRAELQPVFPTVPSGRQGPGVL